jgi:Na+/H+ antiporter NhaD/arsenite permease-like protein
MLVPAILSIIIFFGSLILIFTEKLNRSITAIAGAALMVALGKILGFYSEEAALEAIDANTLGLLLGMMILVAMLEPTGFFQYLAVLAARSSKGKPGRLFILLGIITTILSMFLDNVTTVVLIAPVTILICEIMGISSLPFLVSEALLSNTGGVATLVGDPPNVLIGSAAGLSFNDFLLYSMPIVLVSWAGALFLLQYLFRRELSKRPRSVKAIMRLNPAESLNEPLIARRILIVLGGAVLFFFVHHALHISPSLVALGAAAIALVWVQPDIQEVLKRIEWSVLIFFGALFVMVGGLEHAGVMDAIVGLLERASNVRRFVWGWFDLIVPVIRGRGQCPDYDCHDPVIRVGETDRYYLLWWALLAQASAEGYDHRFHCNIIDHALENTPPHHIQTLNKGIARHADYLYHCKYLICNYVLDII